MDWPVTNFEAASQQNPNISYTDSLRMQNVSIDAGCAISLQ